MKSLERTRSILCATVFIISIVLFGCSQSQQDSRAEIVVYGSPSCSLCTALKADLESRNIGFTFVDISADRDALIELSRNIAEESWFDGTIAIPIVSVNETYLRRPTVDEIRAIQSN